ncbi:unnamed protein product [Peronospora destructor]|uniref:PH domain-containing protein n=1 Tax=Peronospora destructor TaxID=86335 RepID=A0AAV0V0R1_9STRA|nr:unnamed protein product [Peronospora destructor]
MTDDSDILAEDDPHFDNQNIAKDNCNELQVLEQPQCLLSDWVYWQRDAVVLPDCWTRVFAVFCDNVLWLYRYEDASARSLLVRMYVTALDIGEDARQLQFRDAETTSHVQLCLLDAPAFYRWHRQVTRAVTDFSIVKDEVNDVIVSTKTTPATQKKSLWRGLPTVVLKGNKFHTATQEENAIVLHNRQIRKSLKQRWKNATTALLSTLKLSQRLP